MAILMDREARGIDNELLADGTAWMKETAFVNMINVTNGTAWKTIWPS